MIPDSVIGDDNYFENFRLKLPESAPDRPNRFKGLAYATLGEYKTQFELRTIRNVIIKQNTPQGDDSSMYEVFNRLNTGGINLKPQEIRMSMYHSPFYDFLYKVNSSQGWRKLVGNDVPDLHMKDIEVLLRGFAMLIDGDDYSPSMVKFLNKFSREAKRFDDTKIAYLHQLMESFLKSASNLPPNAFTTKNGRFNVALYEAAFYATCKKAYLENRSVNGDISEVQLNLLESDSQFGAALAEGTTQTRNVLTRLQRAVSIIGEH